MVVHDVQERFLLALESAALAPEAWTEVCDAIADMLGARGAVLISDRAEPGHQYLPHSASLGETVAAYYEAGLFTDDVRVQRGFPLAIARGYASDQDIADEHERRSHPFYAEFLHPHDVPWFAGTAIRVGGRAWGLSLQRGAMQGPFQRPELEQLAAYRDHLRLAVRRSGLLGHKRVQNLEQAFSAAAHGFVALDATGRILFLNQPADDLLGGAGLLAHGRLAGGSHPLSATLQRLIEAVVNPMAPEHIQLPPPLTLRLPGRPPMVLDAMPMPRDFGSLLSGATAVLSVRRFIDEPPSPDALRANFLLTEREAQVGVHLAGGDSPEIIATSLGMSVSTVRQHLKAIFRKTNTSRQAQLVALLRSTI